MRPNNFTRTITIDQLPTLIKDTVLNQYAIQPQDLYIRKNDRTNEYYLNFTATLDYVTSKVNMTIQSDSITSITFASSRDITLQDALIAYYEYKELQ